VDRWDFSGSIRCITTRPSITISSTIQIRREPAPIPCGLLGGGALSAASAFAFTYEAPDAYVFDGLDHLEGEPVDVIADQSVIPARPVSAGQDHAARPAISVLAGLPYVSLLKPIEIRGGAAGWHLAQPEKAGDRVAVSLYKSLGGEVSTNARTGTGSTRAPSGDPMDSSRRDQRDREVDRGRGQSRKRGCHIRQAQPLPSPCSARW